MRVAGLFAGIGGFECGLEQAGHQPAMVCEILPTACAVLAARFPDVPLEKDVKAMKSLPRAVDLVCAGFPCQDLSQAGRTLGMAGTQSSLVGEVFRLLKKRRARWLVLENVPFMLQLHAGRAMRDIISELELLKYRWAYRVVDTYSFGLPQRRERVFIVASTEGDPETVLMADDSPLTRPETAIGRIAHGFYWTEGIRGLGWAPDAVPTLKNGSTIGIPSQPAILKSGGQIIKPDIRDGERLQGFDADWTVAAESVAPRGRRWGLVGSAVSVPVSAWLGERLQRPGSYAPERDMDFPSSGRLPRAARGNHREAARAVKISADPIGKRPEHLEGFLRYPGTPLSAKATRGFYARTEIATLKFPEGFREAVRKHQLAIERAEPAVTDAARRKLAA
jgi:DNA (cytosine-5)-methyltransferase 1